MQYYVDIDVLEDPEFNRNVLMNALFSKFHKGLVKSGYQGSIAVSFPEYRLKPMTLGKILRLHGSDAALAAFMRENWLTGMFDHVRCSSIQNAPATCGFVQVKRKQSKSNVERLRARFAKRHSVSEEEAKQVIPFEAQKRLALPFVSIRSQSTDQRFNLFIQQTKVEKNELGDFNGYGLSQTATVPWF